MTPTLREERPMAHRFDPALLREYDMRGIVGQDLVEQDAWAVGRSFGSVIMRAGGSRVVVGYDGRLSSAMLETALVAGLTASGIDVLRIGLCPTPMLYYAEAVLDVEGGIQVTGSHNPADHNGFKLVQKHRPFFGDDIRRLGAMAASGDWTQGPGDSAPIAIMDRYVARLMQGFDGAAWRIGWDAGNGAAGPVVEKLVKLLPGEHHLLFTDIDGNFPHHHPDPTQEANLAHLRDLVLTKQLDFGVAFDGDGDRIGVVDGKGRVIWGDQLLGLFAEPVLKSAPGSTIIADVKTSQAVFDCIAALGGQPLMWKSGHSLIKSKMAQTGSPLAGEMTGHLFFADDYYGFDDGLYAAVRLIRAATTLGRSVTDLRGAMPAMVNTPELRFPVAENRKFAVVAQVLAQVRTQWRAAGEQVGEEQVTGEQVDDTDGVRVRTPQGWWLLRASHTQAALVARAEATDEAALAGLLRQIDAHLADSGVIRDDIAETTPK